MLLPGLYAWLTTVGLPALQRGSPGTARLTAGLGLVALIAGPFLTPRWPRIGRSLGIFGFVGLSVVTWTLLGPAVTVGRLEPIRAALGSVGWALFALGWGSMRELGTVPEDDPNAIAGPLLVPRAKPPSASQVFLWVGVIGSLPPLYLAWRVTRPDHALLAHAMAVLSAIALVFSAARIGVDRGAYRVSSSARQRLNAAVRPLGALALALGVGFVWLLVR